MCNPTLSTVTMHISIWYVTCNDERGWCTAILFRVLRNAQDGNIFVLCYYYYYLLPSSCAHISYYYIFMLCCSVRLATHSRAPGTARVVHKSLENSRIDPAIASRPRAREQWADHSYAIMNVIICNIIIIIYIRIVVFSTWVLYV